MSARFDKTEADRGFRTVQWFRHEFGFDPDSFGEVMPKVVAAIAALAEVTHDTDPTCPSSADVLRAAAIPPTPAAVALAGDYALWLEQRNRITLAEDSGHDRPGDWAGSDDDAVALLRRFAANLNQQTNPEEPQMNEPYDHEAGAARVAKLEAGAAARLEVFDPFELARRLERALASLGPVYDYTRRTAPLGSIAAESAKDAYEILNCLRADLDNRIDVTQPITD